ncbi:MAG: sensor histidine kinase [Candidatus Cryptobacteroides sp.]
MKRDILKNMMIFSGLGCFSYYLIINYTDFSPELTGILYSSGAVVYTIIAFNLFGFLTLFLSQWVNRRYVRKSAGKRKTIAAHVFAAAMFLIVNYSILVLAKLLSGVEPIWTFSNSGWHLLIMVWLAEMLIIELMISNRASSENQKLKHETSELQLENAHARYVALQNQLNPHFLFNSLNTLISEIRYNPANAEQFTQHLSNVYRYVLQCQDKDLVPLGDELTFLRSFLFLHKVRLGDCLSCNCNVDDSFMNRMLPPLSLQLLVENVIKHNSISPARPMVISISTEGTRLVVSNPKAPKKVHAETHGIGLKNLSSRCVFMTGEDISIKDTDKEFAVTIPTLSYDKD